MDALLFEIACDGENLAIIRKEINGLFFYRVSSCNCFEYPNANSPTFIELKDCWAHLKKQCPKWYKLYLIKINSQMIDILKDEYLIADCEGNPIKERWLQQLFGTGLGF